MIRVKICGIRRYEDALRAAELGAAAIGFVFYPRSPRFVTPSQAAAIARDLPPFVARVGVFVDPCLEEVESISREVPLTWVQLHGNESPEFCRRVGRPVLKAFRVGQDFSLSQLGAYSVQALLLDGFDPKLPGGSGRTFPWHLALQARQYGSIVVAGGITAENAAEAIRTAKPDAIDVSSGVERRPGEKDHDKLKQLFDVVHSLNEKF